MARVLGSYPIGRWFESCCRYHFGPLVKRLRHRPFTAESWVQFPYGSPDSNARKHKLSGIFSFCGVRCGEGTRCAVSFFVLERIGQEQNDSTTVAPKRLIQLSAAGEVFFSYCRDRLCRVRQFSQQRERKLASPERGDSPRGGEMPLSGEACLFKRFVGTRRAVSDVFAAKKKSLETFHRNVSKIKKQQPAHRAERSCSLRPRKAVAFLTHLLRAPKAWRRGFRRLRTATQRAARPLRTPRQLCSAGSA